MKKSLFLVMSVVILAMGFMACKDALDVYEDTSLARGVAAAGPIDMGPEGSHNNVDLAVSSGNVYYLAPDGSDTTGTGAIDAPWFSMNRVQDIIRPGDTVYLRGGVYQVYNEDLARNASNNFYTLGGHRQNGDTLGGLWTPGNQSFVVLRASGTEGNPITYATYPPDMAEGKRAIICLVLANRTRASSGQDIVAGNDNSSYIDAGITFGHSESNDIWTSADWIHIYGIDIRGMPTQGTKANFWHYIGSNNTIEFCRTYDGSGNGVFIPGNFVCQNILIKNNDFFNSHNLSGTSNSSIDGIQTRPGVGSTGLVLYGNRVFLNGDDGTDSLALREVQVIDHCWSFWNGLLIDESGYGYSSTNAAGIIQDPFERLDLYEKYGNTPDRFTRLDGSMVRNTGGNRNGFKVGGMDMTSSGVTAGNPDQPYLRNDVNFDEFELDEDGQKIIHWPQHVIRYSLAVGNSFAGISNNYGIDSIRVFNNTSTRNWRNNYLMVSRLSKFPVFDETTGERTGFTVDRVRGQKGGGAGSDSGMNVEHNAMNAVMLNNISFRLGLTDPGNGLPATNYRRTQDYSPIPLEVEWLDMGSEAYPGSISNNSWALREAANGNPGARLTWGWHNRTAINLLRLPDSDPTHTFADIDQNALGLTDADFMSFDESELLRPRNADGSLPNINFMRPVAGGRADGIGHNAPDTNADGFGNRWKQVGARPWAN